ncbi:MAG: transposase [Lewinellaceae bacterium]|nr:transposase [Saprospiraceae bacterium]MCB9339114.1 transposase [Lewinellaceae bacterium]
MSKRIHVKGAAYHATTVCQNRYPFFQEDIFCNVLLDVIANSMKIKQFKLLASKINPDHIHLALQRVGRYSISEIMHNIKRISSVHINLILCFDLADSQYREFELPDNVNFYRQCFQRKYSRGHEFPPFDWQDGFDDQLIRSENQLQNTIGYIEKQALHHDLENNHFLFVSDTIPSDLVFIGEEPSAP